MPDLFKIPDYYRIFTCFISHHFLFAAATAAASRRYAKLASDERGIRIVY